ncbi:protein subunit release factor A [Methylorubrum pseudosasae]|nr:protein subunit release factor A [Methylorubrum pseudosasae]
MTPIPSDRLDAILARHDIVTAQLADGSADAGSIVQLSRELSELDGVAAAIHHYRLAEANLAGIRAMIDEPGGDPEMRALAARGEAGGRGGARTGPPRAATDPAAEGCRRREECHPRNSRRHRR